ncbi:MAG: SlyX family protein [Opitutaceae bacterium]|nr:SlyX family protein [Opitutaceae bacterium]
MSPERADRIEERIAWLEKHLAAQDKAMLELHEEIERLRRDSSALRDRLESAASAGESPPPPERPPHY